MYALAGVCAQTESHGHLLDLSYQMVLALHDVRQSFFRSHPVDLEIHVLRDDCMCPAAWGHQAIFVQYRHDLDHRVGFIHHDRFLHDPLRPKIRARRKIKVDECVNSAVMIQDVVVCQATFSIYSEFRWRLKDLLTELELVDIPARWYEWLEDVEGGGRVDGCNHRHLLSIQPVLSKKWLRIVSATI